jgi:aspartyl protease family protein
MLKLLQCLFLFVLSMNISAVEKITISGLFNDKAIVTIDGKQRLLKVGKSSPEGVILISANAKEAVIEINGEQNIYKLGQHIGSNYKKPSGGNSVSIAPDGGGMYEVNGSINEFQVRFLVDTGATFISMNENHAKRFGINYKLEGKEALSETASGLSKIYLVNLKTVMVGGIKLRDVHAAVHHGEFPRTILLGNTFLGRVKMIREGQMLNLEEKPY